MTRSAHTVALLRRMLVAAALLMPLPASAQLMPLLDDPTWGPSVRLTPYIGWAAGYDRDEAWTYRYNDGTLRGDAARFEVAGGPVVGLNAEYAVRGPFSALAGGAFLKRDDAVFQTAGGTDMMIFTGSSSVLLRLGASAQFRERESDLVLRRLAASAHVAPFVQFEKPEEISGINGTDLFDSATHFGINFGISGELPFASDRFALQGGLEDYFTWYDQDSLGRLPGFLNEDPRIVAVDVDTDARHQWVMRLGGSFRFR